jgi:hypothetical protein
MVADDCGLANHDVSAAVNEKTGADGRARMYVNAGESVGVFGHDAGKK